MAGRGAGADCTTGDEPIAGRTLGMTVVRGLNLDDALDPVLRRGALLLALQVTNVVLGYLSQLVLARWLGGVEFGVYAYAWAWASLLAVPAGLGLATVSLRFMPAYAMAGESARAHALVRWSGDAVLVAGVVVAVIGGVGAFAFRDALQTAYRTPLSLAFVAIPFLALSTLRINQGHALQDPAAGYLPWILGSTIGTVAVVAAVFAVEGHVDAVSVIVASSGIAAGVSFVQGRAIARRLPHGALARARPEARNWLGTGAPMLVSAVLYVLLERADLILVGTMLGPREAGIYGAAARTALLASLGVTAVTTMATPRVSALHAVGDRHALQALTGVVGRWTWWPTLLVVLLLLAFGAPILALFGLGFREGWTSLALLAVAQLVPASVGLAPHLLNMTGHQTSNAVVMVIALVVSLGLALPLIPALGMLGGAIAAASAMVVRAVGHAWMVHRTLGVHTFVLHPTLRGSLA